MRLARRRYDTRGDTIIEVMFAIVIFSFITISSLAIMNQGIATGEKALEITLVRQQVNAQAEALRYIHNALTVSPSEAQLTTWKSFSSTYGQSAASEYGVDGGECILPQGGSYHPFILNARTAEIWTSVPSVSQGPDSSFPPYSQVVYNSDSSIRAAYGLWVEAVPIQSDEEKSFIDFHIRACWPAPGSSRPMTIGTIVRLYDPVYREGEP